MPRRRRCSSDDLVKVKPWHLGDRAWACLLHASGFGFRVSGLGGIERSANFFPFVTFLGAPGAQRARSQRRAQPRCGLGSLPHAQTVLFGAAGANRAVRCGSGALAQPWFAPGLISEPGALPSASQRLPRMPVLQLPAPCCIRLSLAGAPLPMPCWAWAYVPCDHGDHAAPAFPPPPAALNRRRQPLPPRRAPAAPPWPASSRPPAPPAPLRVQGFGARSSGSSPFGGTDFGFKGFWIRV